MKKIVFLILVINLAQKAVAQCTEPFTVPYTATIENAAVPVLPDCMDSTYMTFDSDEVFKSIEGPVDGFDGKLLAYNTFTQAQGGGAMAPTVGCDLYTHDIQLEQGVAYIIGYRYKNSDASKSINSFGVRIQQPSNGYYLDLTNHLNITGATVTNYTSQPFTVPATGAYSFDFIVGSVSNQGYLYLDTITVQKAGVMGITDSDTMLSDVVTYPNPTTGNITVSSTKEFDKIELYSLAGKLLCTEVGGKMLHKIDMDKYAAGLYLLHIYQGNRVKKVKISRQ